MAAGHRVVRSVLDVEHNATLEMSGLEGFEGSVVMKTTCGLTLEGQVPVTAPARLTIDAVMAAP